ncbi:orcokinin peptides [Anabrus simplex]|uniref:orcokinin peptides n=1 Tax=Anabrus simplex TaxID=316456 RepID=UPI0034DD070E
MGRLIKLLLVTCLAVILFSGASSGLPSSEEILRETPYQNYRDEPSEVEDSVSHIDNVGADHYIRNLEGLAGGRLLRQSRGGLDSLAGNTFGGNKRLDTLSGMSFGNQKRNFDEIDRSGFNSFVKKNFDEIDRSGFDSFVKRNFDEIDRAGFGSFVKRGGPSLLARYFVKEENQ